MVDNKLFARPHPGQGERALRRMEAARKVLPRAHGMGGGVVRENVEDKCRDLFAKQAARHFPSPLIGSAAVSDIPITETDLLREAGELHRAGRPADAEARYRAVLERTPHHAIAQHNLGVLLGQQGRVAEGLPNLQAALAAEPRRAQFLFSYCSALLTIGHAPQAHALLANAMRQGLRNEAAAALLANIEAVLESRRLHAEAVMQPRIASLLAAFNTHHYADMERAAAQFASELPNAGHAWKFYGLALLAQGKPALEVLQRALALMPDDPDLNANLGTELHRLGRLDDGAACYRRALALQRGNADAHNNLGRILQEQGDLPGAIAQYHEAVRVDPNNARAFNNLGGAHYDLGQNDAAVAALRQAITIEPQLAEAHNNLGNALFAQKRLDGAAESYRRAVELKPDYATAYSNLGAVLKELGRLGDALAACRTALKIDPNHADAYNNAAIIHLRACELDEAAAMLLSAVAIDPRRATAHNNLGNYYKDSGQLDEAIAAYRRASEIESGNLQARANLLYLRSFHLDSSEGDILAEARAWGQGFERWAQPDFSAHDRDPKRRLRVGYLSPDFREHCQSLFLVPLLSQHDHSAVEVFCYASVAVPDAMTERLTGYADVWRPVAWLGDEALARQIRDDGIDILIDLTMHMSNARPGVLARKPAPIQITWLAYPGTTGMPTIDYRLSDPWLDPPELGERRYAERTWRLPDSFWCYDALDKGVAPNRLPAFDNGHITFGCFNNFCKLNERTLSMWAALLRAVPEARLRLLAPKGAHRERVTAQLAATGVAATRIDFVTPRARPAYLALYHGVDICLDTLPYNGHTTSLDAYWMGVPVVTRVGSTVVGRAGWSQLNNLGMPGWAAWDDESFTRIAIRLTSDLAHLAELRSTLRSRMAASPLMDAPRFARGMEMSLRGIWRIWCEEESKRARTRT